MATDEDSHCGVTTETTTKSRSQVHVRAVQQRVPVRVAVLSNSTAVAALDTVLGIPVVARGKPIDKVVDVPSHAATGSTCHSGQLRRSFLGPAQWCRAEGGHVHRHMAPTICCIGWLARRDLFVIHTVRTTPHHNHHHNHHNHHLRSHFGSSVFDKSLRGFSGGLGGVPETS